MRVRRRIDWSGMRKWNREHWYTWLPGFADDNFWPPHHLIQGGLRLPLDPPEYPPLRVVK